MHLSMILLAVGLAWAMRWMSGMWPPDPADSWPQTLAVFLFAPLLLLSTAIAILCMGPQGQMMGMHVGWSSYLIAAGGLIWAGAMLLRLGWLGWRSCRRVMIYPQQVMAGQAIRILESPLPFAAQVGFWQPHLVVSQGLLQTLSPTHVEAVLTHEQAHAHYRDTFWFFWLGWLRRISLWLPQTDRLWQELLLQRELRADRWAAQRVESLLLAESLLQLAPIMASEPDGCWAGFSCAAPPNRLERRIAALLDEPTVSASGSLWRWSWLLAVALPLLTVLLHH